MILALFLVKIKIFAFLVISNSLRGYNKFIVMGSILGLFFHSLGGFASGSFYIPYRKIKVWSWESAWFVGGVF